MLAPLTLAAASCDSLTGNDYDSQLTGSYEGQLTETRVITATGPNGATTTTTCQNTFRLQGSVVIEFDRDSDGTVEGRARVNDIGRTETALSGPASCAHRPPTAANTWQGAVAGTTSDVRFSSEQITTASGGSVTNTVEFSGVLTGSVLTGALSFRTNGQGSEGGNAVALSGTTTISVTLQ
jgi:hypothetical protein